MTLAEAKELYREATRDHEDHTTDLNWWKDVRAEIEQVVQADTLKEAASVIDWWGCWYVDGGGDKRNTATACARRIRETWAKMQKAG